MKEETNKIVSPMRLRLGVFLIILWWLPFWLLAPAIAEAVGGSTAKITTAIVIVQTIIGALGVYSAGSQVSSIIKGVPKRQAIGKIWQIFLHGTI